MHPSRVRVRASTGIPLPSHGPYERLPHLSSPFSLFLLEHQVTFATIVRRLVSPDLAWWWPPNHNYIRRYETAQPIGERTLDNWFPSSTQDGSRGGAEVPNYPPPTSSVFPM